MSALLVTLLLGDFVAAAEGRLYRYRDAKGKLVVSNSIPAEQIAKGYQVLNSNGRLLETVPPHTPLTDEEKAARAQLASQKEEDRFLLASFSSITDIEAARDRKLESLHREIASIKDNLKGTSELRVKEERRAADLQRGGRKVPESLLNTLQDLQRKAQEAQSVLEQRRLECEEEERRYSRYINRYRELFK